MSRFFLLRPTAWMLLALSLVPVRARAGSDAGEPLTSFHREWVWSTIGDNAGIGGFSLVDIDGEPGEELVLTTGTSEYGWSDYANWSELRYANGEFRQSWSSLSLPQGLRLALPTTQDGAPRVVAVAPGVFELTDGRTKRSLLTAPIAPLSPTAAGASVLLPGGSSQLLVCDSSNLYLYDLASGAAGPTKYGFGCTDLAVGQLDGDPAQEIVLAGNSLGTFVLDGATLQVEWALPTTVGQRVRLADLDADGLEEIVLDLGPGTGGLAAYKPGISSPLWSYGPASIGAITLADIQDDATPEVIFGGRDFGTVNVLAGSTGLLLWSLPGRDVDIGAIAVGDPDRDGDIEIIWTERDYPSEVSYRLVAASATSHSVEGTSLDLNGPLVGLGAGDSDADGARELVTATLTSGAGSTPLGGRVLVFDFRTKSLEYFGPPTPASPASGVLNRVLLLQADADSPLEICSAFSDYSGSAGLECEDGASHELAWSLAFPSDTYPISLLEAEIDQDAFPELIVGCYAGDAFAFEAESGWLKYRTPGVGNQPGLETLRVGDVEGGPGLELVAGAQDYTESILTFDSSSGLPIHGPWYSFVDSFDLAQMDADAPLEIVTGTSGGDVAVLDPETGQLDPPLASFGTDPIAALRVVDVTRDGIADLVVVVGGHLIVRDGDQATIVWTSPHLGFDAGEQDRLWVADLDDDGVPELAVLTHLGFAIFEAPLLIVFGDGFESGDASNWSSQVP